MIEIWDEAAQYMNIGDLYYQFTEPRERSRRDMVSQEVVDRARKSIKINGRYDKQEYRRVGGCGENMRKDWTPAQKRRMNKNFKKMGSLQRV